MLLLELWDCGRVPFESYEDPYRFGYMQNDFHRHISPNHLALRCAVPCVCILQGSQEQGRQVPPSMDDVLDRICPVHMHRDIF